MKRSFITKDLQRITNSWYFPRKYENNEGNTNFQIWQRGIINKL